MKKALSHDAGVLSLFALPCLTLLDNSLSHFVTAPPEEEPTLFSTKKCLVWMKKALSHDAGVCFIHQVGKRALFAKINNSD